MLWKCYTQNAIKFGKLSSGHRTGKVFNPIPKKGNVSECSNYCTTALIFSPVAQSCPTLCDPMNRSTPGLPVHHQLLEFPQTQVHWVGDAIQPSHPQSSPFPPAPNPSQHQSLFQWVNSSHEVAKVLDSTALVSFFPKDTRGWSPSEWTDWISLQSKGLSGVFFNTIQKHQFFGTQLSL